MYDLVLSTTQKITFVLVDMSGSEVVGLGNAFTVEINKNGAPAFVPGVGTKAEMGYGWYSYEFTSAETNTTGPLSVSVVAVGCVQQNLEYVVEDRMVGVIEFTYTMTDSISLLPLEDVVVIITTDITGINNVWMGETNAFGIAVDSANRKPRLVPGTYYFWRSKAGYVFTDPDTEAVSL